MNCKSLKIEHRETKVKSGPLVYPVYKCKVTGVEVCALMEVPNWKCETYVKRSGDGYAGPK